MSYKVFRLTRNAFWGHYVTILRTLTKPASDRIRSTLKTLYLPLSHLVEYRGLIRSGPIQVLFMPRLCHVLNETVYLFTCLINYFISNRWWPTIWKRSNIVPVFFFKKESATDKTCYRLVSILTALSKLYELMFHQMYEAFYSRLSRKSIWLSEGTFVLQSASKNNWGLESIYWHKRACYSSGCWFNQGFYSVCHPLLLAKLKAYSVTDNDALELDNCSSFSKKTKC